MDGPGIVAGGARICRSMARQISRVRTSDVSEGVVTFSGNEDRFGTFLRCALPVHYLKAAPVRKLHLRLESSQMAYECIRRGQGRPYTGPDYTTARPRYISLI